MSPSDLSKPRLLTAATRESMFAEMKEQAQEDQRELVWSVLETMHGRVYKLGNFNSVFFGNKNNTNTYKS